MNDLKNINYYLLAVLTLIFDTGAMGARFMVPLFSDQLHASPTEIGIIAALYSILPLIFVIRLGKWVDRIGSKKPIIYSTLIGSLTLIIPFFMTHKLGLYLLQITTGLSMTMFAVAAQNYMGNTDDQLKRENNIAIFSISVAFASFLGPFIAGILSDTIGYGKSFALFGIASLISPVIAIFMKENKVKDQSKIRKKSNAFDLLKIKNLRKAFLITALILLGKDIYVTYFPLLAQSFGLSNKSIGFIVSSNALAGIFIRWLMPFLIRRFGRNKVILLSILTSGIFFLILPVFKTMSILMIISFLVGMGLGIGQPMSITTTMLSLPKDRVGEGLGLRLSVNRLTQVVAPIVFGTLADFLGFSAIFIIVGTLLVTGSLNTKIEIEQ